MALEILYELEISGSSIEESVRKRRESGSRAPSGFTVSLAGGVRDNLADLDTVISKYAEAWSVDRMPVLDRNIIRLALYEIFHEADIPVSVSINEAVEMAKKYGTEDSGKFVNGVLGRIVQDFEAEIKKSEERSETK